MTSPWPYSEKPVSHDNSELPQLLIDSKNRKTETEEIENNKVEKKSEVIEPINKVEDKETNTKEELVEQEESNEAKLEEDKNE